jgi:hypothetical protein
MMMSRWGRDLSTKLHCHSSEDCDQDGCHYTEWFIITIFQPSFFILEKIKQGLQDRPAVCVSMYHLLMPES